MRITFQKVRSLKSLHFAFATDGATSQLIGIAFILNFLIQKIKQNEVINPIWIVGPKSHKKKIMEFLNFYCDKFEYRYIDAETKLNDKYYIQISLTKVFDEIGDSEFLIYLDYDHLIIDPSRFWINSPSSNVYVSSEVSYDLSKYIINRNCKSEINFMESFPHINLSFICGRISDLKRIGNQWNKAYDDLLPHISVRCLVEIAFGLAAQRSGVDLIPCDSSIQSNFKNRHYNHYSIFHYGGTSTATIYLKRLLESKAKYLHTFCYKKKMIQKTHQLLIKELLNIISHSSNIKNESPNLSLENIL